MRPITHCLSCNQFRDDDCMWPDCELAGEAMFIPERAKWYERPGVAWSGMIAFGVALWAAIIWMVL